MSPRAYASPARQAAALETQRRILRSAGELFAGQGYGRTSIKAIADHAGVSVPSVNLAGTKPSLLVRAVALQFMGDEDRESFADRPSIVELMADPNGDRAIGGYALFLAEANAGVARLVRAMQVAADSDDAVRAAVAEGEVRRRDDMLVATGWMVQRGFVTEADVPDAAITLAWVTSTETYLHFVDLNGWTIERYAAWLESALRRLVFSA
ncbi:helix-turn-helix domain-containing protein [Glaciihabitans sp. dw_435]|uniref:helix-turn-helix domain-containing protein n=1 Tax=Glaciihabitans sp. dw_435 TaxID=2720081 RepID=UPI001BD21FD6|nr:helix-turn-helix domain-containing protein [Glaciihabitans sp. dw_435]